MYNILQTETSQQLVFEVNEFLKNNIHWELYGNPYSDGHYHYQAVLIKLKEEKQLLID